jgi:hypothetical protein
METKAPDRLNIRLLLMLAILGLMLGVAGWLRYFGV